MTHKTDLANELKETALALCEAVGTDINAFQGDFAARVVYLARALRAALAAEPERETLARALRELAESNDGKRSDDCMPGYRKDADNALAARLQAHADALMRESDPRGHFSERWREGHLVRDLRAAADALEAAARADAELGALYEAVSSALESAQLDVARLDKAERLLYGRLMDIVYGITDAGTYPTLRAALDAWKEPTDD